MPDRNFIETYPLYRKFKFNVPPDLQLLPKPAIHMHRLSCKSGQTFNMVNIYFENSEAMRGSYAFYPSNGAVVRALYMCNFCNTFIRLFFIKIDPDLKYVIKVGQTPPWEISMNPKLEKMLGGHSEYYKKGLTCESQGYGIGAFAYYRRIIEEIIDQLLEDIKELIIGDQHDRYLDALEQVEKTKNAQDKIQVVKDLLPPTLRPGGINPLSTIHDVLSEGLHSQSDERCMELAMIIRDSLIYLVDEVIARKSSAKTFTESMRKLLSRKPPDHDAPKQSK